MGLLAHWFDQNLFTLYWRMCSDACLVDVRGMLIWHLWVFYVCGCMLLQIHSSSHAAALQHPIQFQEEGGCDDRCGVVSLFCHLLPFVVWTEQYRWKYLLKIPLKLLPMMSQWVVQLTQTYRGHKGSQLNKKRRYLKDSVMSTQHCPQMLIYPNNVLPQQRFFFLLYS